MSAWNSWNYFSYHYKAQKTNKMASKEQVLENFHQIILWRHLKNSSQLESSFFFIIIKHKRPTKWPASSRYLNTFQNQENSYTRTFNAILFSLNTKTTSYFLPSLLRSWWGQPGQLKSRPRVSKTSRATIFVAARIGLPCLLLGLHSLHTFTLVIPSILIC